MTVEALERDLSIINAIDGVLYHRGKWCQHRLRKIRLTGTKYCLLGAGFNAGYNSCDVSHALVLPKNGNAPGEEVAAFNDRHDMTFEQIKALLGRRRVQLEEAIKLEEAIEWARELASPIAHGSHEYPLAGD